MDVDKIAPKKSQLYLAKSKEEGSPAGQKHFDLSQAAIRNTTDWVSYKQQKFNVYGSGG